MIYTFYVCFVGFVPIINTPQICIFIDIIVLFSEWFDQRISLDHFVCILANDYVTSLRHNKSLVVAEDC